MTKRAEQKIVFGIPELIEDADGNKYWEGFIYIEQNNKPRNPIKYIPPNRNHEGKDSLWMSKSMFYSFLDTARLLSDTNSIIMLYFPNKDIIKAIKEDPNIWNKTVQNMAGLVYELHSYEKEGEDN